MHDPENGTGKYGEVISESAIDIDGYDKVDPTSATLNIHVDEGEGAPNLNIITFYYKESEVTINYVAVGPTGATDFGSVNPTTETLKVKTGTAQGSTPTAGDGYKFVGWYKDKVCTEAVDASWVTDNKIIPQKTDGKNVAATYYAKFERDLADLTITKAAAGGTTLDSTETFMFEVTTKDKDGKDIVVTTVIIHGSGSVTLKDLTIGKEYTVTEKTDWSWRYEPEKVGTNTTPESQKIIIETTGNKVTFTNKRTNNKWLDGNAWCQNIFKDNGIINKLPESSN